MWIGTISQVNRNNRLPPVVNSLEFPQEQQSNSLRVTPLRVNRPSTSFQPELEQILLTSAGSPSSLQGFFNQVTSSIKHSIFKK